MVRHRTPRGPSAWCWWWLAAKCRNPRRSLRTKKQVIAWMDRLSCITGWAQSARRSSADWAEVESRLRTALPKDYKHVGESRPAHCSCGSPCSSRPKRVLHHNPETAWRIWLDYSGAQDEDPLEVLSRNWELPELLDACGGHDRAEYRYRWENLTSWLASGDGRRKRPSPGLAGHSKRLGADERRQPDARPQLSRPARRPRLSPMHHPARRETRPPPCCP